MREAPRRRWLKFCAAGSVTALAGCLSGFGSDETEKTPGRGGGNQTERELVDDWQYEPPSDDDDGRSWGLAPPPSTQRTAAEADYDMALAADDADDSIGLAAGGAADVGTFRRNVYEGFLPIPEAMSYEGLFHEYYFDTGGDGNCQSLFCPTYTPAITDDPLSGETERYLSVGLDSGLAKSDFERPPLNLVLVLDISGSMRAAFDEYYYDRFGNEQQVEEYSGDAKMEIAKDVLIEFTHHLEPDDRLGIVLFDHESYVAKPMRKVGKTDMDAIRNHIQEDVRPEGGTNISAGMEDAETLLEDVVDESDRDYEHRTILLTDAQINWGETDADELHDALSARAEKRMHTSVIGIGVDFNADLINQITKVRGANYYSVYSANQFEQRLLDEFEYMVTPLVYDLSLELDADGYDISQVYGSTAADEATGEMMSVNTLFPSPSEGGDAKGGVVLVQVEQTNTADAELTLEASWERRDGQTQSASETITFPDGDEHWGNDAIRKATLLARHADLLKQWTITERVTDNPDEREYDWGDDDTETESEEALAPDDPIEPPEIPDFELSEWELQSQPLTLSPSNAERLSRFRDHLETEKAAIGDEDLQMELELLEEIFAAG